MSSNFLSWDDVFRLFVSATDTFVSPFLEPFGFRPTPMTRGTNRYYERLYETEHLDLRIDVVYETLEQYTDVKFVVPNGYRLGYSLPFVLMQLGRIAAGWKPPDRPYDSEHGNLVQDLELYVSMLMTHGMDILMGDLLLDGPKLSAVLFNRPRLH